jgi:hypothetical protein
MASASNIDPSTSQRDTLSKTRLANIPKEAVDQASRFLRRQIFDDDSDEQIWNSIGHVWKAMHEALEKYAGLEGCLADEKQFLDNVKSKGKRKFIDSLRDMAKKGTQDDAWYDLFEDGTLFSFLGFSRRSDRVLRLDVFLKKIQASKVNPPRRADVEGKQ